MHLKSQAKTNYSEIFSVVCRDYLKAIGRFKGWVIFYLKPMDEIVNRLF